MLYLHELFVGLAGTIDPFTDAPCVNAGNCLSHIAVPAARFAARAASNRVCSSGGMTLGVLAAPESFTEVHIVNREPR